MIPVLVVVGKNAARRPTPFLVYQQHPGISACLRCTSSWVYVSAFTQKLSPRSSNLSVKKNRLAAAAAAAVSGQESLTVETPYVNAHGSGWFFFLSSGSTGTYAADHRQHCIRKLDPHSGKLTWTPTAIGSEKLMQGACQKCYAGQWHVWAGDCDAESPGFSNGLQGSAKFNQPQGICNHPRGHLIVADKGNHCIRQVSAEGAATLVMHSPLSGSHPQTQAAQCQQSQQLLDDTNSATRFAAVMSCHYSHVIFGNQRSTVSHAQVLATYAGTCGQAGDVDGAAQDALFSKVFDVQCLSNCSVLVSEPGSGRVRLILDTVEHCRTAVPPTGALLHLAFVPPQHMCLWPSSDLFRPAESSMSMHPPFAYDHLHPETAACSLLLLLHQGRAGQGRAGRGGAGQGRAIARHLCLACATVSSSLIVQVCRRRAWCPQ